MTAEKPKLKIMLAEPRGFCAGVERAIDIVKRALEKYGAPVYVRHEIVHNQYVLQELRALGAVFVNELDEVPENVPVIFSAHGVPKSVPQEAERRNMHYIDATCPLVSKVHKAAKIFYNDGKEIVMIGHKGHPEVVGTTGQLPKGAIHLIETPEDVAKLTVKDAENLAYVTQTTLSLIDTKEVVDALKKRFPNIAESKKEDICYATTNRQEAVTHMAANTDMFLVVGSQNSSNSNRLVETAKRAGSKNAMLVDNANEINWQTLGNVKTLGITAGASAPEILVQGVIDAAKKHFDVEIETITLRTENTKFNIPKELR